MICFSYFIAIGLVTSLAYCFTFRRFYSRIVKNRKSMNQMQISSNGSTEGSLVTTRVPVTVKIALVASVLFGLISLTNLYYIIAMLLKTNFYEKDIHMGDRVIKQFYFSPWFWYIYQSVMRICDFLLCSLITFVAGLPLYRRKQSFPNRKEQADGLWHYYPKICALKHIPKALTNQALIKDFI